MQQHGGTNELIRVKNYVTYAFFIESSSYQYEKFSIMNANYVDMFYALIITRG